jgi:hypothetical protein
MRKLREVHGWTASRTAAEFGRSGSHISRIERGTSRATLELVRFYEETFGGDGMLWSLYQVMTHSPEQNLQRAGGHRPPKVRAIEGDASTFVEDNIPHGTQMEPGVLFVKSWTVLNSGTVPWRGRQLERQGPLTGPGLITSARLTPIPDTEPGETAEIQAILKAPGYDCTSIAYFKMIDADGYLCYPDNYQLGLDVLVTVRGQKPVERVPFASAEERERLAKSSRSHRQKETDCGSSP